jgi:hypothetical protein
MDDDGRPVRARLAAGSPQAQVLTPLALVMGSRAGLSLEQIDDLSLALELIVRGAPAERWAHLRAGDGEIEITLSTVDPAWLDERRSMLEVLVGELTADDGGVQLRVSA